MSQTCADCGTEYENGHPNHDLCDACAEMAAQRAFSRAQMDSPRPGSDLDRF